MCLEADTEPQRNIQRSYCMSVWVPTCVVYGCVCVCARLCGVAQQHMEPLGAAQSYRHSTAATANSMVLNISYVSLFSRLREDRRIERSVCRCVCVCVLEERTEKGGKYPLTLLRVEPVGFGV